jgi:hypothetical protein
MKRSTGSNEMTPEQAKVFFDEINDQRTFRSVMAIRLDKQMELLANLMFELKALAKRVDEYIEAQTYDLKGKR